MTARRLTGRRHGDGARVDDPPAPARPRAVTGRETGSEVPEVAPGRSGAGSSPRAQAGSAAGLDRATIAEICTRLAEGRQVRRALPGGGRLHIDRPLPFLCVCRVPPEETEAAVGQLVLGEAAYLLAVESPGARRSLGRLVRAIARTLAERLGGYLILEVWESPGRADSLPPATELLPMRPHFIIHTGGPAAPLSTVDILQRALRRFRMGRTPASVAVDGDEAVRPPRFEPVVSAAVRRAAPCHLIGLEVSPVYRDPTRGDVFPATLRAVQRGVSRALKQAMFTFARTHTSIRPSHYESLGRRAMVKAVWDVDRRLSEIAESFDFLWQTTPVNAEAAWQKFHRSRFQRVPQFEYRPLAVEPGLLKRRLYAIPIEKTEDPTLADLFRQRQDELDRKITMLADIGTPRFLLGSLQVYGGVPEELRALAEHLLEVIPARSRDRAGGPHLGAEEFAARANEEIAHYRRRYSRFTAAATVRDDMYSGLLVSGGELRVGRQTRVPAGRVDALLQHEVGTHLVTHFNGGAQPFRQLQVGLAGYDALQEGLAVLAEHLVGGLSRPRLRLLAARVVAVHRLIEGAGFLDTFRLLWRSWGFTQQVAYTITMRVYRGGGLTKDVLYLAGLMAIIEYLREGGEIEPLLIGKIAAEHVPLVRELTRRQVLRPAPLRPRYLDIPEALARLSRVRSGLSVAALLEGTER